ncbi:hypothetical protein Tco_0030977 [Tanacetum coccineum]
MDDGILSSNNTTTNSFFKPCLITRAKNVTKKEDEQSQTKRKYSNTSNSIDEQPNKRRCQAEKFEAIQYSLGPNEEYIAIRGYEFDIWERNEDNLSIIYKDIFQKKDEGWKSIPSYPGNPLLDDDEGMDGPWKQRIRRIMVENLQIWSLKGWSIELQGGCSTQIANKLKWRIYELISGEF